MLKSNKFFYAVLILTLLLGILINYFYFKSKNLVYTCSSELTLSYPDGNNIYASFNGFIFRNGTGLSTYRGTVVGRNREYALNSDFPFKIHGNKINVIVYGSAIKKYNDTTPDNMIFREMLSKDATYYLSFYTSPEGDIVVKDRGAITYICSH